MWFRNAMVPQRKTCGNGHLTFFRGFLHHPGLMKRVTFLAPLLMGDPQVQLELRNVPPLRVYARRKRAVTRAPAAARREM